MIGSSFITQIGMLMLVFGMFFLHIEPTLSNIGQLQDSTLTYMEELEKVTGVNQRLFTLKEEINDISAQDISLLSVYLPKDFNHVKVSSDINVMSQLAGVELSAIAYDGATQMTLEEQAVQLPSPTTHTFTLSIKGTYFSIKQFLGFLEQNNYPLDVMEFAMRPSDGDLLTADMVVTTYSETESILATDLPQ